MSGDYLPSDERGVWLSVGAIILVSIMVLATTLYVRQQLPQEEREQEYLQSQEIERSLIDLQESLEDLGIGETTSIHLPTQRTESTEFGLQLGSTELGIGGPKTANLPLQGVSRYRSSQAPSATISGQSSEPATNEIYHSSRWDFEGGTLGENVRLVSDPYSSNYGELQLDREWYGNGFRTKTFRSRAFRMTKYDFKVSQRFTAQQTENIENARVFITSETTEFPSLRLKYSDNSVEYLYASADTYIDNHNYENERNTNYGSDTTIEVGWHQYFGHRQRALLRFDMSRLPAGKTIDNAQLVLACDEGTVEDSPTETEIGVYEYTNDVWREDNVTWVNYDDTSIGTMLDSERVDSGYTSYYWDVTSFASTESSGDGIASLFMKYLGDPGSLENDVNATFKSREFLAAQLWIAEDDGGIPGGQVGDKVTASFQDLDEGVTSSWNDSGWIIAENLNAQIYEDNVYHLVTMSSAAYSYPNEYTYFAVNFLQPRNRNWVDPNINDENRGVAVDTIEDPGLNQSWTILNYEPVYVLDADTNGDNTVDDYQGNPYHSGFRYYNGDWTYSDLGGKHGDDKIYAQYYYEWYGPHEYAAGSIKNDGYDDRIWGENFTISSQMTIDGIEIPVSRFGNPGSYLKFTLENSDGTIIEKGFVNSDDIRNWQYCDWYGYEFSNPITLSPGRYWFYLSPTDYTKYDYYLVPTLNAEPYADAPHSMGFDAANSHAILSVSDEDTPPENWTPYENRDLPFRLLKESYKTHGVYTSPVLGDKSRKKWLSINLDEFTPSGTDVQIEVRMGDMSQPDNPNVIDNPNHPWTQWKTVKEVQDLAEVFADNELTSNHLQYRLTFTSPSSSLSPSIESVSVRYYSGEGMTRDPPALEWIKTDSGDLKGGAFENTFRSGGSVKPIKISGGWNENLPNTPTGTGYRSGDTTVGMNGKVYWWVGYGGPPLTTNKGTCDNFYEYDPGTNSWSQLTSAPFGSPYGMTAAEAVNPSGESAIYIIRGYWSGDPVELARYVPGTGWTNLTSTMGTVPHLSTMPQDYFRNGLSMVWDHGNPGYIYVLPGSGYDYEEYDWYRYDIANDSWEWMGNVSEDLPYPNGVGNAIEFVEGSAAGLSENYLYAVLGKYHYGDAYHGSGPPAVCVFARYGLTSQSWELINKMGVDYDHPYGADDGSGIAWDGGDIIYHTPGSYEEYDDSYVNTSTNTEEDYHGKYMSYSISSDSWTEMEPMPWCEWGGMDDGGGKALVGGKFYVLKGGNDSSPSTTGEGGGVMGDNFWSYSVPEYYRYGRYISKNFDLSEPVNWGKITIENSTPAGNSLQVFISLSDDGSNWSDWMQVGTGDTLDNRSQWIKYKVEFDVSADNTRPPIFHGIRIKYTIGAPTYDWIQNDWSGGETTPTLETTTTDSYSKYYDGENVYADVGAISLQGGSGSSPWGDNFRVNTILASDNLNSLSDTLSLRFKAQKTENVNGARVYVNDYGDNTTLALSIYNDSSGQPGSMISSKEEILIQNTGWVNANFSTPASLTTDNVYHLQIQVASTPITGDWTQTNWTGGPTGSIQIGNWSNSYDNFYENENVNWSQSDKIELENATSLSSDIANHVVVSEVYPDGVSEDSEFVELYNPTGSDISLNGYTLAEQSGNSTTFGASDSIPSHGYYLVGFNAGTKDDAGWPNADINVDWSLANTGEYVTLEDDAGSMVDNLGYDGDASFGEGGGFTGSVAEGESFERKSSSTHDSAAGNGYDTDNNNNDFFVQTTPNPDNSTSGTEDPPSTTTYATGGWFTSSGENAENVVRWDNVSWTESEPNSGDNVDVYVRFENISGWSTGKPSAGGGTPSWQLLASNPQTLDITSRYVQYGVVFETADTSSTPEFSDITLNYTVIGGGGTWTDTDWSSGSPTDFDSSDNIDWKNNAGNLELESVSFGTPENYGNEFRVESTSTYTLDDDNKIMDLRFTAQQSQTISSVRYYLKNVANSPTIYARLENDNSSNPGKPGGLAWTGAENYITVSSDGWVTADLASSGSVTAGTVYHLLIKRDPWWTETFWTGGSGTDFSSSDNIDWENNTGNLELQEAVVGGSDTDNAYEAATNVVTGENLTSPDNLDADDQDNYEVDAASSGGGGGGTEKIAATSFESATDNIGWSGAGSRTSGSAHSGGYKLELGNLDAVSTTTFGYVDVSGYTNVGVSLWIEPSGSVPGTNAEYEGDEYAEVFLRTNGGDNTYPQNDNFGIRPINETYLDDLGAYYHRYSYSLPAGTDNVQVVILSYNNTAAEAFYVDDLYIEGGAGGPATYSLDVQHDSGTLSVPGSATLDNVHVKLNFSSDNSAIYTWQIWDNRNSEWDNLDSGSVGATEVTWENTLATDPDNYLSSNDNIRVRMSTSSEDNDHLLKEDYLFYEVNYTVPTQYYDSGTLTSLTEDSGDNGTSWQTIEFDNSGYENVQVEVAVDNTDPPSNYQPYDNGQNIGRTGRYARYRVTLGTNPTDNTVTPVFEEIRIYYVPPTPTADLVVSTPQENMLPENGVIDENANVLWSTDNGASWSLENKQPIYLLANSEGNPYAVAGLQDIYGSNFAGENLLFAPGENKQVTEISVNIRKSGSPPELRYSVWDETDGAYVVDNKQLAPASSVGTSYGWVENTSVSFKLENGHRYRFYLHTPGGGTSNKYIWNTPDTDNSASAYTSNTYDGTSSKMLSTSNGGTDWTSDDTRDATFRFTIERPDEYKSPGVLTSLTKDAGSSVTWDTVSFDNTGYENVTVEVRVGDSSPPTDGTWTQYDDGNTIGPNGQYAQYRVTLGTNPSDNTVTPIFQEIRLSYSGGATGEVGWATIRASQPLENKIPYDQSTDENQNVLSNGTEQDQQPIYVIDWADSTYGGNPYTENNALQVSGTNYAGEKITASETRVARGIWAWVRDLSDNQDLNYRLYEGSTELENGTLAASSEVGENWTFVSTSLASEHHLTSGNTYRIALSSSSTYELSASTTSSSESPYLNTTFNGTNAISTASTDSGSNWSDNNRRDALIGIIKADNFKSAGMLESSVYDAGGTATWGVASWTSSEPSGTNITVKVRTDSDSNPTDQTWTTINKGTEVGSTGQFIQYKVEETSSTGDATPTLQSIKFEYQSGGGGGATSTSPMTQTWTQTTREDFLAERGLGKVGDNLEIMPPGDIAVSARDNPNDLSRYWGNLFYGESSFTPSSKLDDNQKMFAIKFTVPPGVSGDIVRLRNLNWIVDQGDDVVPGDSPGEADAGDWWKMRLCPDDGTGKPNLTGTIDGLNVENTSHPDKYWSAEWYMPFPRMYAEFEGGGNQATVQGGETYYLVITASSTGAENYVSEDNYIIPVHTRPANPDNRWINNESYNENRAILFSTDGGTTWKSSKKDEDAPVYDREPVYLIDLDTTGDNDSDTYIGNPYYASDHRLFAQQYHGEKINISKDYGSYAGDNINAAAIEFYMNAQGDPGGVYAGIEGYREEVVSPVIDAPSGWNWGWTRFTFPNPRTLWENESYKLYIMSPGSDAPGDFSMSRNPSEQNQLYVTTMKTAFITPFWVPNGWKDATYGGTGGASYIWSRDGEAWSTKDYRDLSYRIVTGYKGDATFTSKVYDAGQEVLWKRIEWDETRPPGTTINVSVRSGNSRELSGVSWQSVSNEGSLSSLASSRYIQYKVELQGNNGKTAAPVLHEMRISYTGGLGDITIETNPEHFSKQTWAYEGGAVILKQENRSVMRSEPDDMLIISRDIADHVVISEIYPNPWKSPESEFVELYNPTSSSIDLNGWSLLDEEGDGYSSLSGSIPANGYYLVADSNWSTTSKRDNTSWPNADEADDNFDFNRFSDEIRLTDDVDGRGNVVDTFGYNNGEYYEGTPYYRAPSEGDSLERKSGYDHSASFGNAFDTNNNNYDFRYRASPQPENSGTTKPISENIRVNLDLRFIKSERGESSIINASSGTMSFTRDYWQHAVMLDKESISFTFTTEYPQAWETYLKKVVRKANRSHNANAQVSVDRSSGEVTLQVDGRLTSGNDIWYDVWTLEVEASPG